ncbi:MAG: glycosyltransferase [Muribaculaceae bacterium]|nr:glycosyltransferase [Muribaculaceae bacterium]
MKIVIVNHSDMQGGAAIVSLRLAHALQEAGVDARMLVIDKQSGDPLVGVMGSKYRNKWNFLSERLGVFMRNGFRRDTLFKIDTGSHGINIAAHPWVKDADVVCLNWVNQGTLSLKNIKQLAQSGKPIVWTMHDMWNCTGVCHYSFECERYKDRCHSCPLLETKGDDLSTTIQEKKRKLYEQAPIHFVAVSHWLAECCKQSKTMSDSSLSVIYNAFPIHDFDYHRLSGNIKEIPADKKIIVMGARRLDVEVKGFKELIETTQYIARNKPELASKIHLVLYGELNNKSLLNKIEVPCTYLGSIGSTEQLSQLYRHSDIVLSTALYENLPGTLIEGQASGCLPVTFGKGGQANIVDHLKTGYIAEYKDPASVAAGIEWAIDANVSREFLHNEVERKFAASKIAQQYIELFNNLKTL